jgi:hypothetical protein
MPLAAARDRSAERALDVHTFARMVRDVVT